MKFRKFLVGTLAATILATNFAFAAVPKVEDNAPAAVKAAVKRLGTLGLTKGDDKGNYNETKEVTRAEFATFLVRALGLEDAAQIAKTNNTVFKDVPASHWATGYINVASGQELIKGVGNGKFAPDAKVSYAEAVTMLVRALGYKDEFLPGPWPGNYIARANSERILDGVTVSDKLTRGEMAIMLNNTLDAETVEQKFFGSNNDWQRTGKSLLESKLRIEKVKNLRVVANKRLESGLKSDEVRVEVLKNDLKIGNRTYSKGNTPVIKISKNVDTDKYLGAEVTAYINTSNTIKDNTVVYAEIDSESNTLTDYIKDVNRDRLSAPKAELKYADKKYELSDDAVVFVNNDKISRPVVDDLKGKFGRVVLENGKIIFADVFRFEGSYSGMLVKSVDADKKEITFAMGEADDKKYRIKDGFKITDVQRNPIELKDVKADDVLYLAQTEEGNDKVDQFVVIRNKVEGKIGAVKYDGNKINKVEVDGSFQEFNGAMTYSKNNDKDIKVLDTTKTDSLKDFDNAKAVVIYDIEKKIRHIRGTVKETSDNTYGVVTRVFTSGLEAQIKVVNPAGSEVTYSFESDSKGDVFDKKVTGYANMDANSIAAGDIIKYELTKDGKVAKNSIKVHTNDVYRVVDDFGKDTVRVQKVGGTGSTTYYLDSKTVILNRKDKLSDTESISLNSIKDKKVPSTADVRVVLVADDHKNVKALVFVKDYSAVADDKKSAYVISYINRNGDDFAVLKFFGSSEKETIKLQGSKVPKETTTIARKVSGNKVELGLADSDFKYVTGEVTRLNGRNLEINKLDTYRVESDAVVYDGDSSKSLSDINEGDAVVALVKKGKVEAIKLVPTDRVIEGTILNGSGDFQVQVGTTTSTYRSDTAFIADKDNNTITRAALQGKTAKLFLNRDSKVRAVLLTGTSADQTAVTNAANAIVAPAAEVTANFALPTTGTDGTTIAWTSNNAAIAISGGTAVVTPPAANATDADVTLTATVTKGSATATRTFAVKVKKQADTSQSKVTAVFTKTADDVPLLDVDVFTLNVTVNDSTAATIELTSDKGAVTPATATLTNGQYSTTEFFTHKDATTVTITVKNASGAVIETKTVTLN